MKKTLCLLVIVALMAGVAQARETITTNINSLADGTYSGPTVVTNSQSYGGATFDIVYTIEAFADGSNAFLSATGGALGVGSDADTSAHYGTFEGDENAIVTLTDLKIENFDAGSSATYSVDDITGLTFTNMNFVSSGHKNDGINISFDGGTTIDNQTLYTVAEGVYLDLTLMASYVAPATSLYLTNDSDAASDRWSIGEIQVSYVVDFKTVVLRLIGIYTR